MAGHEGLNKAARNKKDEFYTDLTDLKRDAIPQKAF